MLLAKLSLFFRLNTSMCTYICVRVSTVSKNEYFTSVFPHSKNYNIDKNNLKHTKKTILR